MIIITQVDKALVNPITFRATVGQQQRQRRQNTNNKKKKKENEVMKRKRAKEKSGANKKTAKRVQSCKVPGYMTEMLKVYTLL